MGAEPLPGIRQGLRIEHTFAHAEELQERQDDEDARRAAERVAQAGDVRRLVRGALIVIAMLLALILFAWQG